MKYNITATASWKQPNGYTRRIDYPTFVLDGDIQGITDRGQAMRIARAMLTECMKAFDGSPFPPDFAINVNAEEA